MPRRRAFLIGGKDLKSSKGGGGGGGGGRQVEPSVGKELDAKEERIIGEIGTCEVGGGSMVRAVGIFWSGDVGFSVVRQLKGAYLVLK